MLDLVVGREEGVESVGEVAEEFFFVVGAQAITGMATSLRVRVDRPVAPTMISSSEEPSTSDVLGMEGRASFGLPRPLGLDKVAVSTLEGVSRDDLPFLVVAAMLSVIAPNMMDCRRKGREEQTRKAYGDW